jgi:putative transport protein
MDSIYGALQAALQLLDANPVLLLFLLMGSGYLLGNIKVLGFSLGPVAGILFAGIFLGHYGLRLGPAAQSLGFALFIFSVGYQAGPRFFGALRADGVKYFLLALTVAFAAVGITLLAATLIAMKPGNAAGLLAGGLTSSPTLAAAQDAIREGSVHLPAGMTRDEMVGNIASAYAITYIFGLTGLITIIRYLPRLLGLDIAAESRAFERRETNLPAPANITTRWYRVSNPEFIAMTASEIRQRYCPRIPVASVIRSGEVVSVRGGDHLHEGDILELIAPRALFSGGIAAIGDEIPPELDVGQAHKSAVVVVTNKAVCNQTLGELAPPVAFGVLIEKIIRAGVELPHSQDLEIQTGDIYHVAGKPAKVEVFGRYLGHMERNLSQTDMITFAFGIVLGILLGMLSFTVGGIAIGLGTAGGLLAAGLGIGYMRSVRPTFGRLPEATSWWLMEFGLLLFMAGVGLSAGGKFIDTLTSAGPLLVVAGVVVTSVPLLVAYFIGSKLLRLNPAILMGALTGAMTSGASLSVVTREARSAVPAIGYAGTYAFGNVFLMVAGPVVLLLA